MKTSPAVFVLLALAVLLPACYTLNTVNGPTERKVELSNADKTTVSDHVVISKWHNHFIWGLVTPDSVDITRMLAEEVGARGGKGAVNVRVKYEMTFVNGLLNVVTAGIYNPFTLTVAADIVK